MHAGSTLVRPLIRWAGSKRLLLPELQRRMPSHYGRYIEPFAGSAVLFFQTHPRSALLADNNADLINAYRWVSKDPSLVSTTLCAYHPGGNDYYAVRDKFKIESSPLARAAHFLYLNRFGFNGVYRTNRLGHYNVPKGTRTPKMFTEDELITASLHLRKATIRLADFRETVSLARTGDFLYIDPPYTNNSRSTYGEYGYASFNSLRDLPDLRTLLSEAAHRGVKILVSFGDPSILPTEAQKWDITSVATTRRIAANPQRRGTSTKEILATNYRPVKP